MADVLTTGDVARALGVTLNTVKSWIRVGKLEALRLPSGHYRIPAPELDRLIREGSGSRAVQLNRQRELFAGRRRAWAEFDRWGCMQPPSTVSVEEALAHMDAVFDLAREIGPLLPRRVEEKVAGIARMRRALSCLGP